MLYLIGVLAVFGRDVAGRTFELHFLSCYSSFPVGNLEALATDHSFAEIAVN